MSVLHRQCTVGLWVLLLVVSLLLSACSTINSVTKYSRPTGVLQLDGDTLKAGFALTSRANADTTIPEVVGFTGMLLLYPSTGVLVDLSDSAGVCGELVLRDTTRSFQWRMHLGCVAYGRLIQAIGIGRMGTERGIQSTTAIPVIIEQPVSEPPTTGSPRSDPP